MQTVLPYLRHRSAIRAQIRAYSFWCAYKFRNKGGVGELWQNYFGQFVVTKWHKKQILSYLELAS
jgi:hypothetical protein